MNIEIFMHPKQDVFMFPGNSVRRSLSTTLETITSTVRETSVFRHNGDPIKGPLLPKPLKTIVLRGSEGPSIRPS